MSTNDPNNVSGDGWLPAGLSPISRLTTAQAASARAQAWLVEHGKRMRGQWPEERERLLGQAQRAKDVGNKALLESTK